jgi:hypothetical protein
LLLPDASCRQQHAADFIHLPLGAKRFTTSGFISQSQSASKLAPGLAPDAQCIIRAMKNNMNIQAQCQNCGTKYGGFFTEVQSIPPRGIEILNLILNKELQTACSKCAKPYIEEAKNIISKKKDEFVDEIRQAMRFIPAVSIHAPPNWVFETVGLMTGTAVKLQNIESHFKSAGEKIKRAFILRDNLLAFSEFQEVFRFLV